MRANISASLSNADSWGGAAMKVSELEDAELDYWVAKAIGKEVESEDGGKTWFSYHDAENLALAIKEYWEPSSDWSQLGPLIEEYEIDLEAPRLREDYWSANTGEGDFGGMGDGETPLIAACRAIVASKYGETVDDN